MSDRKHSGYDIALAVILIAFVASPFHVWLLATMFHNVLDLYDISRYHPPLEALAGVVVMWQLLDAKITLRTKDDDIGSLTLFTLWAVTKKTAFVLLWFGSAHMTHWVLF